MSEPNRALTGIVRYLRAAALALAAAATGCWDDGSSFERSSGRPSGGGSGGNAAGAGGTAVAGSSAGGAAEGRGGARSGGTSGIGGAAAMDDGNGEGGDKGATGVVALTLDEFWQEYALALCHHYMRCLDEPYRANELRLSVGGDEQRCASAFADHLATRDSDFMTLNAGVGAGVLHLDPAGVEACLATARACGFPWVADSPEGEIRIRDITPCREAFEGTVPVGGGCEQDVECAGDAYCTTEESDECSGTCAPRLAEAADCARDGDCGGDVAPNSWPLCYTTTCAVREPRAGSDVGGYCGFGPIGRPLPCAEDLWCQEDGTCAAQLDLDSPCFGDTTLSQCHDGACVDESCTPLIVRGAAGETCDEPAVVCNKFQDLVCVAGVCAEASTEDSHVCENVWFYRQVCPLPPAAPEPVWCMP